MPRQRITQEQAIERYGSLENYEAHLAKMLLWHKAHAEEQKDYRWKNRDRERARSRKWRSDHPEQVAQIKLNHKNRRLTDPVFASRLNIRTRSRYLADRLGIDRTGCELHHYTEPMTLGNFIVLKRDRHRWLHSNISGSNKRIDLGVIKAVLPMLGNVVLVKDGKLTSWEEA